MTYAQAVAYLESLKPAGMQMGLERMEFAMQALGHPETSFRAVHIAGTNGKGSTAAMIAAMLTANGHRVGLFSSPSVIGLCDTIQINSLPLTEEALAEAVNEVYTAMPEGLSEYECLTSAAFCAFRSHKVDIAVIECCLGGETDCTNVFKAPLCAVFTSISLDHTAILGDTVEAITKQKSGIIKPPCDIVCAPNQHEEALGVLFETAAVKGLTVYTPAPPPADKPFCWHEYPVTLGMQGKHQKQNAATALTVLQRLQTRGIAVDWNKAIDSLKTVSLPCRLEQIGRILLDGAHNPQGIDVLYQTICERFDKPITLIIGMLRDKNTVYALEKLAPLCKDIYCCTPVGNARALPAKELAAIAKRFHSRVYCVDSPVDAFESAKKTTGSSPIVIGGSFYTAGAVRSIHISG